MTYEDMIIGIKDFATERGINKKENAKGQFFKLMGEIGELANAIKYDDRERIIDSIGNIQVILIILCEQLNLDYKYALRIAISAPLSVESYEDMINFIDKSEWLYRADTLIELGKLADEINKVSAMTHIGNLQHILISFSFDLAIKYKSALESAYDVIVKDEDLHD